MILTSIIVLGALGIISAGLLYWAARRFHVAEDPRVEQVEALLPGANCGGCGHSGCHAFALACTKTDDLSGYNCPGAGPEAMKKIAEILGLTAEVREPVVAVIRCNGTCDLRPRTVRYDGVISCAIAAMAGTGETGCPDGCLGCGDCETACGWDAIHINSATGLPEVDYDRCTGCGVCVKACPRNVIELRPPGPKGRRVWVACNNRQRGAIARKICAAACIGCAKCAKECNFGAITVANNLAYIDPAKCRLCRKCIAVCPTGAIHATWTPPAPKPQPSKTEADGQNV